MTTCNNKKIKVGMIISTYYPIWGGAQRQLKQIGEYLLKSDIDIFILTRRLPGTKKYELIENVPVHRVFVTNFSKYLDSLLFTFLSLVWLLRHSSEFDILHCYQMYSPATIGVIAKLILKNKKVIVKITSSNEYGETNEIKRLPLTGIRTNLLKRVDKFLVVNNAAKTEMLALGIGDNKIEYLPNGVNIPVMAAFDNRTREKQRSALSLHFEKIIIFTGRITREKNLTTLIHAWSRLRLEGGKAHLIILGEGTKERSVAGEISCLISELKLEDSIHMLGKVENVFDYLLASDIFVLPSISEGLSNSLLEAMACGLTVVAGDIPGNRQVIRNGENGLLINMLDEKQMCSTLTGLLKNRDRALVLGQKARETVEKSFSLDKIASDYKRIYRSYTN